MVVIILGVFCRCFQGRCRKTSRVWRIFPPTKICRPEAKIFVEVCRRQAEVGIGLMNLPFLEFVPGFWSFRSCHCFVSSAVHRFVVLLAYFSVLFVLCFYFWVFSWLNGMLLISVHFGWPDESTPRYVCVSWVRPWLRTLWGVTGWTLMTVVEWCFGIRYGRECSLPLFPWMEWSALKVCFCTWCFQFSMPYDIMYSCCLEAKYSVAYALVSRYL